MEDVETHDLPAFVHCDARVCLRREEFLAGVVRQRFLLRECIARLHDLVPDGDHAVDVILFVFSDCHLLQPLPRNGPACSSVASSLKYTGLSPSLQQVMTLPGSFIHPPP